MTVLYTPEADANQYGPRRALTLREVQMLQRGMAAGVSARELAKALKVSVRTIYRYRDYREQAVTVDGWTASFLLADGRPPRQTRSWLPVRSESTTPEAGE